MFDSLFDDQARLHLYLGLLASPCGGGQSLQQWVAQGHSLLELGDDDLLGLIAAVDELTDIDQAADAA